MKRAMKDSGTGVCVPDLGVVLLLALGWHVNNIVVISDWCIDRSHGKVLLASAVYGGCVVSKKNVQDYTFGSRARKCGLYGMKAYQK